MESVKCISEANDFPLPFTDQVLTLWPKKLAFGNTPPLTMVIDPEFISVVFLVSPIGATAYLTTSG